MTALPLGSLPATLPDHFPAISVSVQLGQALQRQGKIIEVDPFAANEMLIRKGFPEERLDDVELYFGRKDIW